MVLKEITEKDYNIALDLRYATTNNVMGQKIYDSPRCFLHQDALEKLEKAILLAEPSGFRIKIFDAYRPQAAQEKLWKIFPNPMYVADPKKGSHHTRGIAIDLTLVDKNGQEIDMGTPFDDFTETSHHGATNLSYQAAHNRYLLLGLMMSAGFDLNPQEWWHYQLFNPYTYPLLDFIPKTSKE